MKIGVIGDQHFKEHLAYGDYVSDGRKEEWQNVLDTIVKGFKEHGCQCVVFMGDNFHAKNNPSSVIKEFVKFVDRLDNEGPRLYFLGGNHEKTGSGQCAIDFLRELNPYNFGGVITKEIVNKDGITFCPYFTPTELGLKSNEEVTGYLLDNLTGGDILFIHHAISGTPTSAGMMTDLFAEPVLPRSVLKERYKLVVAGHIHAFNQKPDILVTGSIFTEEVGEKEKAVWVVDSEKFTYEPIWLPVRPIIKLENPTSQELAEADKNSIVRIVLTDKNNKGSGAQAIQEKIREFSGGVLVEQYPYEREKELPKLEESIIDLSVEKMLNLYADQTKTDKVKLQRGWQLIQ